MTSPEKLTLDRLRAHAAVSRGWITRQQFQEAEEVAGRSGGSMLAALKSAGAFNKNQLADFFRTTLMFGTEAQALKEEREVVLIGDKIAERYVVRQIHCGGFGRVYVCDDLAGDKKKQVAIKTPLRKTLSMSGGLQQFYLEAARWIRLGPHPNVVRAIGIGEHLRLPFVLMEYIESGETLAHVINNGGTDWSSALRGGIGIARALDYGFRTCGLVHGDLKPLNILVEKDGTVKVNDFGLSVAIRLEAVANVFNGAGTPGYMAPELCGGGRNQVTVATDMYAFGVILFEIATGERPTSDDDIGVLLCDPVGDLLTKHPSTPPSLAKIIGRCLAPDPEKRPESFAAVLNELSSLHYLCLRQPPKMESEPSTATRLEDLFNLASSFKMLGILDEAERAARCAVELDPNDWRTHLCLGNCLFEEKPYPHIIEHLNKAHVLAPNEFAPQLSLAAVHWLKQDKVEATNWLKRALPLTQPSFLEWYTEMITDLVPAHLASQLIDDILAEKPQTVGALDSRAVLLRMQGRLSEALENAEQAITLNPLYAKAYAARASILLEMGQLGIAVSAASRAIELDRMIVEAWQTKAKALAELGQLADARQTLHEALSIYPGYPCFVEELASLDKTVAS
jgi:serine/threonine protein kinase